MTEISLLERIVKNPAFGLIPFFIFSFIIGYIDFTIATGIALALTVIGFVFVNRSSRLLYNASLVTFAITLLLSITAFSDLPRMNKFIVVEVLFTLTLILTRLSKGRLLLFASNERDRSYKNLLKESFRVTFQSQYGLTIHLLLFMTYLVTVGTAGSPVSALFMKGLFQLILLGIMILEPARIYILSKKLYKEEWLPVVTETGNVTGRIAKSVTKDLKNRFMHPVVRVALMYKGSIYLKERNVQRVLNPGKLDFPFEQYMEFNDELDKSVKESVGRECGNENIPLRFLLKYTFENEITKRLIFLYVSEIEDETLYNSLNLHGGKLWTSAQIEDNLGSEIFSECFELEFEYLKNTLLLAQQFKNR